MSEQHNYVYYGTKCHAKELLLFLNHTFENNASLEAMGEKQTPICIWGRHGIGKTQIVEDFAKNKEIPFRYIAPAQFEEMGDLIGMPKIIEGDDNDTTRFIPPEWVPTEEGPGILLIDDVNRADDRILRGIMQLLQNYELVSWKLPPKWQIVLTANPDGGDYSVTPMDNAMLTRMLHITLTFHAKTWAAWAERAKVDPRGINFVLTYPEMVSGERTTPRTLVQFFHQIKNISNLKENIELLQLLGDSCLDMETVTSFITYLRDEIQMLIMPEDILEAKDFKRDIESKVKKLVDKEQKRVDILSVICTRLMNHLNNRKTPITPEMLENVKQFILMKVLPNDLRLAICQEVVQMKNPQVAALMAVPEIGKVLLGGM